MAALVRAQLFRIMLLGLFGLRPVRSGKRTDRRMGMIQEN
jgi:hypothetical protein